MTQEGESTGSGDSHEQQSSPPFREPLPCGTDDNHSAGREPYQSGWYWWIGDRIELGCAILDVGAGMCEGLKQYREIGHGTVVGIDVDIRLQGLDDALLIGDVKWIPTKSFDYVTCLDCLEHVVDDLAFLRELFRVAKKAVYITTPHFERSLCQNPHHCREYRIVDFIEWFRPTEIWCASPDGALNHTMVYPYKGDEIDLIFKGDGMVWPHFCAIFQHGEGPPPLLDTPCKAPGPMRWPGANMDQGMPDDQDMPDEVKDSNHATDQGTKR